MSTSAFSPTKRPKFKILQPEFTLTGQRITPLAKGLPKETESLCPECRQVIRARIFEENGKVIMAKTCADHGDFRDIVFSDVALYQKMDEWNFGDGGGNSNPNNEQGVTCPTDCGLCTLHTSHTALANLDLTNRCNLTCPVCFANANTSGYVYEPNFEQVVKMMETLRNERPVDARCIQFSGGEPTVYPRFLDVLRKAKEMGFTHIQAATNGIELSDLDFARECKEAGLATLYLQFDGVTDDIYRRVRGVNLLDVKMKTIDNCRKTGMKIVFVPTIVKGLNDHQIGDIVRVAIENIDCVSGISFQPVAFTGRINRRSLEEKRFTLADLAQAVSDQTGITRAQEDFFPLACVTPFSKLTAALRGVGVPTISSHPHCSLGTYFFVDEETKQAVPITQFVDVGAMLQDMDELSRKTRKSIFKFYTKLGVWNSLKKHFHKDRAPRGLSFTKFLQTLQGLTDKKLGRDGKDGTFTYRTLLVAGMHFQDLYNYDIERVKRCVIHYSAPNGQLYPFCTYNSGPEFREKIEREFAVPVDTLEPMRSKVDVRQNHPKQAEVVSTEDLVTIG
ncbi:Fe-S protein, radical SAM family [Candidatus Koribacter versatilis Ellin345]|uniref:Fe-S protein, radical SAM family n=1 Tax=Koribacter versatilis (strain Ellin345) TaxID=204669 RepID=Q1ITJ3_KORVE|nr:radical SAM protein [Candidatus Koribacter versatilis]ABF39807.1 Fe-S protein, radical SAM family [Candidatus Koribacter versatilis Ellin345]